MKRTIEVNIMGQKFLVRSDSDEGYVNRVAQYVNEKVEEIARKTQSVPSLNVAILAAMNIADEFMRLREKKTQTFQAVEKRIRQLIELIDLHL
ncbi:MAG: cell division protein ZapA [Deltaproteobacteria bacterium]|nr:cell division protein ZapA [Deltaproteobacteria bacterium]